jgi:hypothetical protein
MIEYHSFKSHSTTLNNTEKETAITVRVFTVKTPCSRLNLTAASLQVYDIFKSNETAEAIPLRIWLQARPGSKYQFWPRDISQIPQHESDRLN